MRSALLVVCALTLVEPAYAAPWLNIGPFGGESRSLSSDATGRNVYLLNPRSGIFRSSNGGPWTLVFDAMARAVSPTRVVVDSFTSRVYLGTTTALFGSNDNGTTWQPLINAAIVDASAHNDSVVISTQMDGLLRSVDGGVTWNGISPPPGPAALPVSIIRMDPEAADRLAAVVGGNLFVTDDAGKTWSALPPKKIVAVTFQDLLYTGGSEGVFGCTSGCVQISGSGVEGLVFWSSYLFGSIDQSIIRFSGSQELSVPVIPFGSVLSLEATPNILFAGTTGGVYTTTDGLHWTSRNEGLTNVKVTAMTIASGSLFAATAGQSIQRRSGDVWTSANNGLPGPTARALATNGSIVYATVPGNGVFRSSDQGATWVDISAGLPTTDIVDIAADGDEVVVTTFRSVVQSFNRGSTWQIVTSYPALTATAVAIKGHTIVVSDVASAAMSTDDGATWQRSDVPSAIRHFAIAGDHIYAATDFGLFVRRNAQWNLALPGKINAMAASDSRLYASVPAGIYFSDDGARWTLAPGSETLPPDITSVAIDGLFVYAGTNGGSIFATTLTSLPQRRRAVVH